MKKIDAHQHFWQYHPEKHGWISDKMAVLKRDYLPEDLYPELKQQDIEACIAVQTVQSEAETLFLLNPAERFIASIGYMNSNDNKLMINGAD